MLPKEYQEKCLRSEPTTHSYMCKLDSMNTDDFRILHHAIGICTEAGEIQDTVKKTFYYDKPMDFYNIKEELGDLMWYIAGMCSAINISLEEVMRHNIDKLQKRYPEKFTEQDAIERKDKS